MTDATRPLDMVQRKSGGPTMSVARIDDQDGVLSATCNWLDGS
jgi:uncharacterized protein YodC (DUF2158 family)